MLIIVFFLAIAESSTCYPYQCAPSDYKMPQGFCATSYNGTFFLLPCESTQECDLSTGLCISSPAVAPSLNYPGESCTTNSTCASNNCASGICVGVSIGGTCQADEDCNPALRCNNSTCVKQLDVTESGCIDDNDCINSAMCNSTDGSVAGTCLGYLSVAIGLVVSDCVGGTSYLCKTTECSKIALFNSAGVCKVNTVSLNNLPVACTSYLNCTGSDGTYQTNSDCTCGYNANGTSYCQLFGGDLPAQVYFNVWQTALTASISVCNTARRYTSACLMKTGYYTQVMVATWNYLYYPQMQNNDLCIREMINYQGYPDDSAAYLVMVMAIAIFIV